MAQRFLILVGALVSWGKKDVFLTKLSIKESNKLTPTSGNSRILGFEWAKLNWYCTNFISHVKIQYLNNKHIVKSGYI